MFTIAKKIIALLISLLVLLSCSFGYTEPVSEDYAEGKYKNVILMIGDGMGENTLQATKAQRNVSLAMETMAVKGWSQTRSLSNKVTDSAAGGTALSCGVRVINNTVGVYPVNVLGLFDEMPVNLCELAMTRGMATGVVTTDKTSGATPASFSAHTVARQLEIEISADQLKSGIDIIWGAESDSINKENAEKAGYTYVTNEDELMALEASSQSFAQFNFDDLKYCTNEYNTPTIEEMTEKAIEILSADEDGFFLMVEGACIDKHSHDNDFENTTLSTVEFDKAVAAALKFAEEDGETLVIVTADHETGGITYNAETGEYYYTSYNHTGVDVPVFVSATDSGITEDAVMMNCQIPVQIARVLGFGEEEFPKSVSNLS